MRGFILSLLLLWVTPVALQAGEPKESPKQDREILMDGDYYPVLERRRALREYIKEYFHTNSRGFRHRNTFSRPLGQPDIQLDIEGPRYKGPRRRNRFEYKRRRAGPSEGRKMALGVTITLRF